jgi:hypothetical protein
LINYEGLIEELVVINVGIQGIYPRVLKKNNRTDPIGNNSIRLLELLENSNLKTDKEESKSYECVSGREHKMPNGTFVPRAI